LASALAAHHNGAARPVLIAVNGCQGSGKSTLADYVSQCLHWQYGLQCAVLSLDDFYLTRAERRALAREVHPLFATRGVPGTHDVALLQHTLKRLLSDSGDGAVAIPRFDKARDDRRPTQHWDRVSLPVDIVVLEGWCLGVDAQCAAELVAPVNALERDEDPQAIWRTHVNTVLAEQFPAIYRLVDSWVMLQAPSFDCVQQWRQEQEDKLRQRLGTDALACTMDRAQLARFVQHYQRLTEICLQTLPERTNHLFQLDAQRRVCRGKIDGR